MLKFTQLRRALIYQSTVGFERNAPHFDGDTRDQIGPAANGARGILAAGARKSAPWGKATPALQWSQDPTTGEWLGQFATKK